MPEALAVFFILAVSVIVFAAAWLRGRDLSLINADDELQRLRHHEAWLRLRLELAEREQWSDDMIAGIADEHHRTSLQLARAVGSSHLR